MQLRERHRADWPSLVISRWFLVGVVIFIDGVLGLYIAMIF
jgi:hypothetical protein